VKFTQSEILEYTNRFGEPKYTFRAGKHLLALGWLAILAPGIFNGVNGWTVFLVLGVPPFLLSINLDMRLQLRTHFQKQLIDLNKVNSSRSKIVTNSYSQTTQELAAGSSDIEPTDRDIYGSDSAKQPIARGPVESEMSAEQAQANDQGQELDLDAIIDEIVEEKWIEKAVDKLTAKFDYSPREGLRENTDEMGLANVKILLEFSHVTAIEIISMVSAENLLKTSSGGIGINEIWKIVVKLAHKQDSDAAIYLETRSNIFVEDLVSFLDDCAESGLVEACEDDRFYRMNFTYELIQEVVENEPSSQGQPQATIGLGDPLDTFLATDKAVLIRLNKSYSEGMTKDELYAASRGNWAISLKRAAVAEYAYVLHKGLVVEVYSVSKWEETKEIAGNGSPRVRFTGEHAEDRRHMLGVNLAHMFKVGESSPIKYLNC